MTIVKKTGLPRRKKNLVLRLIDHDENMVDLIL